MAVFLYQAKRKAWTCPARNRYNGVNSYLANFYGKFLPGSALGRSIAIG
jgi:hypothetical protein